jgi:pimeloyl-ACP methyl ester carboxylesterase
MKCKKNQIIVTLVLLVISTEISIVSAQGTIIRKDLTIEFKDGYVTTAQVTIPNRGEGPYPGILLVQGSGACDMNEYIFQGSATGEPVRPLKQLAEHLTKKGYLVLRYNKRGVETNYTKIDSETILGLTYPQLLSDLENSLDALIIQPEVNSEDITLLGHSEGAYLCAIEASQNTKISNLVLMGIANHAHDIAYWQTVELKLQYARAIDLDQNGLLNISEIIQTIDTDTFLTIQPEALISHTPSGWKWNPGIDANGDNFFSINEELRPLVLQSYQVLLTMDYPGSKLMKSAENMDRVRDVINNTNASVLLLHGEDDIVAPISEAELIFEVLESSDSGCTFYRYPGLSHYFYESDGYSMAIGPIREDVINDISDWLDEERNSNIMNPETSTNYFSNKMSSLIIFLIVMFAIFPRFTRF